jgi:ABC-2 type transport system ATP-binding protein
MPGPLPTELPAADLAIATHELSKQYRSLQAVSKLALQVPEGAVYLLVGPNGAGKSTTIKILLDLVRPSSGSAKVLGLDPQQNAAAVRANVGYVPEQLDWGYAWMRTGRLLEHHANYFPSWDREYASRLFRAFDLKLDQKLGTLSKGQGRRVHLAMALAHRPPLLVLDEPTDGLDPVMRDETIGVLIEHLSDSPTTVLLCTHHVSEFEQFADHIGVLKSGELRAQLTLTELRGGLRRYRADIPPGWNEAAMPDASVLKRTTTSRDLDWIVWGDEKEITATLTRAGAVVRDAIPLNLNDATLALLSSREVNVKSTHPGHDAFEFLQEAGAAK